MNRFWSWHVLSDSQFVQVREAALAHIERHGLAVQHKVLLARARARGAHVDETQGRVRMLRSLIAELMVQVPRPGDIQAGLPRHFSELYRKMGAGIR
jgi:trimethylamine:corrinoid methyltransferase-like protein